MNEKGAHKRRMIRRQLRLADYDLPLDTNSLAKLRQIAIDHDLEPFNACTRRSTTSFKYCELERGHKGKCKFPSSTPATPAKYRLVHITPTSEWLVQPFDNWTDAVERIREYSQGGRRACVIEDWTGTRWTLHEAIHRDLEEVAKREAASVMGKSGGRVKTDRKTKAVRENGTKGGRKKKELDLAGLVGILSNNNN